MFAVDLLKEGASKLNLDLTDTQLNQFKYYGELLFEWNKKFNLTAIPAEGYVTKHFLDSLSAATVLPREKFIRLIDIGSGAGFPGIPLKIVYPEIEVTLIDARNKKVSFLEHVIGELKLSNARAVHGRAEDLSKMFSKRFTIAISRALGSLEQFIGYAKPFLEDGGYALAMKGPKGEEDIKNAPPGLKKNCKLYEVEVPFLEERRYIVSWCDGRH